MAPPYRFVPAPLDYPGHVYSWRGGRVLEHHLVWWRATGALVPEGFDLHHKDDVGLNNDFDNLELLPHGVHTRLHHLIAEDMVFACAHCGDVIVRTARDVRSKSRQGQRRFFCSKSHAALTGHAHRVLQHGTSAAYNKHGCRCAVCKKYKAGRALARKAKLADTKT